MSNNPQFHAKRIAPLPELEARFNDARAFIQQHHPDEEVSEFVSMEGLETMHHDDLAILKVKAELTVQWTERRANEVQAELEEAEAVRAESLRRQNQSPTEARFERIERDIARLAGEIAKLKGVQPGRQLPAPYVARADVPQLLGQPGGMGRGVARPPAGGGVRKLGTGVSASASDAAEAGFTRKQHPLNVISG
jgi:hypothetical protein